MNQTQHLLSKPARACWMLLPIACGLFCLLALKLFFLLLHLILLPVIWALIVMRKKPNTTAGQAAESFLTGFLLLFSLYLFIAGVAWLWVVFF